jgi:sulfoxide reductase heme-binding subunit YedZ
MQRWQLGLIKTGVWSGCLLPLAILALRTFEIAGDLGGDPVTEVLHTLGKTGLNILMITLAVTPARQLTGWNWLVRMRRLLGLFAFFYLALHFTAFAWLDLRFAWSTIFEEIALRPYLTLGMAALVAMIPLAITSTRGWQRRLGRKWTTLHRLVYPIAILGVWHYWWQIRGDTGEANVYIALLAALFGYRLWRSWQRRRLRKQAAASTP